MMTFVYEVCLISTCVTVGSGRWRRGIVLWLCHQGARYSSNVIVIHNLITHCENTISINDSKCDISGAAVLW